MDIRAYQEADVKQMKSVWNEIVAKPGSFPQDRPFTLPSARAYFKKQSFCGVAVEDGRVLGLYVLHPNNIGRCAHTANASYAVSAAARGRGIGRMLVEHSLEMCAALGFDGLQFNAVVETNTAAIRLYEKLGFERVGRVRAGYRYADGHDEDILLFHKRVKA